jgi:hypothetical protein
MHREAITNEPARRRMSDVAVIEIGRGPSLMDVPAREGRDW